MIVDYFDDYDTFMYIDISKMKKDLSIVSLSLTPNT